MLRYLRLYAYFVRFSFSRAMEFRVDFFFRVIMDSIFYATNLAFFGVLFQHTSEVGGWNLDQVFIFVSGYFLIDAIHMTVLSNNTYWLPFFINKGDLDYYLVRPVSPLFFLSFRDFAANSFLNLIIASGIVTWAIARYPGELGALNIVLYLMFLVAGFFLFYCLNLMFIIPTFWTHSADGVSDLFFGVESLADRPHKIYRGWTRKILTTVLPFALVASYPAYLLFEGASFAIMGHMVLVIGLTFLAMVAFWRRGLRAYASASS